MEVKITLVPGYSPNVNNFSIYSAIQGGPLVLKASNITAAALAAGHTITVDAATTGGTVNSTGQCTSFATWTVDPCFQYNVYIDSSDTENGTGNTGTLGMYNGMIVVEYINCLGVADEYVNSFLGENNEQFCGRDSTTSIYIWKNNAKSAVIGSYVTKTSTICS